MGLLTIAIGVTWGGGKGQIPPPIFFVPKNRFFLAAELKRVK
jgi:hypothetical protein